MVGRSKRCGRWKGVIERWSRWERGSWKVEKGWLEGGESGEGWVERWERWERGG